MNIHQAAAIASLACAFLAAPAHAGLQTWRLTSTADRVSDGFVPPLFAQAGNVFSIDYVIETHTPSSPGWDGVFSGAVASFSVNGIASHAAGYISATGIGLNAINVWPTSGRADGLDFVSFVLFGGSLVASVPSALNEMSAATPAAVDLRIDFGNHSVWAKPSSFARLSVPEPSSGCLLLLGALPAAFLGRRGPPRGRLVPQAGRPYSTSLR